MSLMTNVWTTFSDFVREVGSRAVFGVQTAYYHWDSVLFSDMSMWWKEERRWWVYSPRPSWRWDSIVTWSRLPLFRKWEKSKISKVNYIITIRNATTHIVCTSTRTHDQRLLPIQSTPDPCLLEWTILPVKFACPSEGFGIFGDVTPKTRSQHDVSDSELALWPVPVNDGRSALGRRRRSRTGWRVCRGCRRVRKWLAHTGSCREKYL